MLLINSIINKVKPPYVSTDRNVVAEAGCLVKLRENRMIIIMLFNHPQFSIAESLPSFNMIALLLLAFITSLFDSLEN